MRLVVLFAVTACGRFGFDSSRDALDALDALDGSVDAATFAPPSPLPGTINTTGDETYATVTASGLELFFGSPRFGGYTIWASRRNTTGESFGLETRVAELDGTGIEFHPELSADGTELVYNGNMPFELRRATRVSGGTFGAPEVLPLPANREGPALAVADTRLFVSIVTFGGIEEYARASVTSPWTIVRTHAQLASMYAPTTTADGLELYASRLPEMQLYRSTRATIDDEFGAPERVLFGTSIDTAIIEHPELSADGHTLYLTVRVGTNHELYVTTR